ncbi:MAG: hypothetical protein QNJ29_12860 [Rhizobiaceae bacterium]|nr:hypothetical protein [Rhizobiaceae bacterium]
MNNLMLGIVSAAFLVLTSFSHSFAFSFDGQKSIKLQQEDGTTHNVGTINFEVRENSIGYTIEWNDESFGEHFLSMRPFKCFEGDTKYWCRVPYPYENKRRVSATELTDLEYDLLFIWKGATEYGINMWNGVYYQLQIEDDRLIGILHEMDMEKLGVPPDDGNLRPIREVDLEEGYPESHWLPRLIIE